eukprot:g20664.t1
MAEVAATLLDESSEEDAAAAVPAAVVTPLPRKRRNRGCLDATPHKTPRLSPRRPEVKRLQPDETVTYSARYLYQTQLPNSFL